MYFSQKPEKNPISLQPRSRMAAVSCFGVMILRWKKSSFMRYGYIIRLWEPYERYPLEFFGTFNIDNKVFHFAKSLKKSLWHPRLQPAWQAVESSCIRSFRASRTRLCFDENLHTHQSVDSRKGIIAFLFKRYIDAFFLLFKFFSSLPRSMSVYPWPWHLVVV